MMTREGNFGTEYKENGRVKFASKWWCQSIHEEVKLRIKPDASGYSNQMLNLFVRRITARTRAN